MEKKIKVLITSGIFPPEIGGPATYAINLCRELRDLGCEVKIITYGDGIMAEGVSAVKRNQNILSRYIKFFLLAWRLSSWADIVYTLDLMSAGLPTTLAAKIKKKKVIFRTGGDFLWEKACQRGWSALPLSKYYESPKNLTEKALIILCHWILNKIDLVIFSTALQANIYQKYFGVSFEKIGIIQNALPTINYQKKNNIFSGNIIFVGRLVKLKNLDKLIRVFGKTKDIGVKLLIFGEGPERKNLEKLVESLRLEERVKLPGSISQNELESVVGNSRFMILPSLTEISPNLALETISINKPIILTQEVGLSPELIAGLVTINPLSEEDIKEKIEYLLNDANLEAYAEKLLLSHIHKREWHDVAKEHLDIFQTIIK